jgi:3-phenylpropionate/cinnamic acid dioxygenase small subunit
MIDAAARAQLDELLASYAHAIDNDVIEDWPLFFTDEGQYLITTRENLAKGRPIGIMYCDGRGMMQDRVTAFAAGDRLRAACLSPYCREHANQRG